MPENLTFSPNPAHSLITITIPANESEGEIKLFDVNGTLIYAQKTAEFTQQVEMDINELPNGLYLLSFWSDGVMKYTGKVSIIH